MNATFFQRLFAYFIDIMLISLILSVIMMGFNNQKSEDINNRLDDLYTSYTTGDITMNEYYSEYSDILYESGKVNIVSNIVNFSLTIAYFVIFQFLNKGQTFGKMLIHIRIKGNDKKLKISNYFIRGLFIYSLISLLFNFSLIYVINKHMFIMGYTAIMSLETILVIICAVLVLYRKDKRGLHDIISGTKVVSEGK